MLGERKRHSPRGFIAFIMMVLIGGAVLYFFIYGMPGAEPGTKSPLQIQMDAMKDAKGIQEMNDERNKRIEDAMKE